MRDSTDYAFAYDQYKESERLASQEKAVQMTAIRRVLAKQFDCFVSDDSIDEAAAELWQALHPEPQAEPLF